MESTHEVIPSNITIKKNGKHLEITGSKTEKKDQVIVNVYLFEKEDIEEFNRIEVDDYSEPKFFERMFQGLLSISR